MLLAHDFTASSYESPLRIPATASAQPLFDAGDW